MTRARIGRLRLGWLAVALAGSACSGRTNERAGAPTFSSDVAPIVHAHCLDCHRPGQMAPFSLVTYDEVRKHASQIALVTGEGYMPPWPPRRGEHRFEGERGLTREEISTLGRWVDAGAPLGDPSKTPPTPRFGEGWQLGAPDLVLRLPGPYFLPAEGVDTFRNFVLSVPLERTRRVRAVELHPGNPRIVHHALTMIDPTPASRRLDERDPEPGFEGMEMGAATPPEGFFLGWTPGKLPRPVPADMAFGIGPGTDFVVQMHMLPTGKPEPIQPEIGLYFTDERPGRRPSLIILANDDIDIPAGTADYTIRDEIVLPVPIEVLGLYPHAHYLGRDIRALATRPDGTVETLLHIPDWDFNWQDDYRFVTPVVLPAGTTLGMVFTYDNSSANERNPYDPPRRTVQGPRSVDEMGSLTLSVVTRDEADRLRLAEAKARHALAADPLDPYAENDLGIALENLGRVDEAAAHYRRAIELGPRLADPHYNLGMVRAGQGELDEAERLYRRALDLDPDHARAHNNLGNVALARGDVRAAIERFEHAVGLQPGLAVAHYNLGLARASLGEAEPAMAHYRRAIDLDPDYALAYSNLGALLHERGRPEEAISSFRRAIEADPGLVEAHNNLALALALAGREEEAIAEYEQALRLDPDFALAHFNLGELLRSRGDLARAIPHLREVLRLDPGHAAARASLAAAEH